MAPSAAPFGARLLATAAAALAIAQQGVLSYRSLTGHASAYKLLYE